jgi:polyhydroxyalkanoate synthesis regulator phasin
MTLEELAQCGRPWAERRARTALEIQQHVADGAMSQDEAQELIMDLARTDQLDREADSIEVRAALIAAVSLAAKAI